jgi:GABA permease
MKNTNGRAHRILVVANETSEGPELLHAVRSRARGGRADVLVVAPALNSRLRHWTSDDDEARRVAEARLRHCLERLRLVGVEAEGVVGDADPLLAIDDSLHGFPADELVIATHAAQRSRWLRGDVVDKARGRFALPVHHVVVASANGGSPEVGTPPAIGCGGHGRLRQALSRPGRGRDRPGRLRGHWAG